MSYSDLYLKQKKNPPFILLILIPFLVIVVFGFLYGSINITTKAIKKNINNLEILNFSYNQVGIFWQSDNREQGWAIYGESENNLDKTSFDERDIQDNKKSYLNHYVLLKELKSNTKYYFKVISNNQVATDINGNAFKLQTPSIFSGINDSKLAYGKVLLSNGKPLENAFVLIKKENAYSFIALTKTTGEWLIPLNYFFEKETNKGIIPSSQDQVKIEIFNEEGEKSKITANIKQISPLSQSIIIGRDYQFSDENNVLAANVVNSNTINDSQAVQNVQKIQIIYPKEGAVIPGNSPLINGVGIPDNDVEVNINFKDFIRQKVKVSQTGRWIMEKPMSFPAGDYILTVKANDSTGKELVLKRNFSIAKSGEQVFGLATGSATPIVVNNTTPTSIATAVPTIESAGFDPTFLTISSMGLIILGFSLLLAF